MLLAVETDRFALVDARDAAGRTAPRTPEAGRHRRPLELGITQEQLAERMGTSSSTVSRTESGRHVTSVTTRERLAATLDVKLLVGFETEAGDRELVSVQRRGSQLRVCPERCSTCASALRPRGATAVVQTGANPGFSAGGRQPFKPNDRPSAGHNLIETETITDRLGLLRYVL